MKSWMSLMGHHKGVPEECVAEMKSDSRRSMRTLVC